MVDGSLHAMADRDDAKTSGLKVVIERYQQQRDGTAVQKILTAFPHLTYESRGYAAGTTEKYLVSPKYATDVLRVDGKTVGFVNYAAYDMNILSFHIARHGLLHLIGVDTEHQKKGYGTLLLDHAIEELKKLNAPNIILAVQSDNINAQKLYEKKNFQCPMQTRIKGKDFYYRLKLDIPSDRLERGNILQRRPKASLSLAAFVMLLWYYQFGST